MSVPGAGGGRQRARGLQAQTLPLPLPVSPGAAFSARLQPEEPLPVAAPFDGAEWRFSVDWEGMRVILEAGAGGEVRIHDERLRDVTALLPEVVAAAPRALRGRAAVLEGVAVLLGGDGVPELGALCERLALATPGQADAGLPLLVTDLLCLDGASLLAWPFERRQEALAGLLDPAPHLQLPEWVAGQGVALSEAAVERGLAAVAGRHAQAPYRAGMTSPQRLRIALEERADTVVSGVVIGRDGEPAALLLAEWEDGRLVDSGRVALTPGLAPAAWLRARCAALRIRRPEVVGVDEGPGATWLRPSLVATVRHHGRTPDGRLRLPATVAVREDRAVRWCVRREPQAVPVARPLPGSRFRPLVIPTLPLH